MAVYRWTYAHRRWVLVAIAVAAATIVGVLVGVGAAVVLLVFLLIAAGFVWRAGYMSEVVSDWSRSRFDSEPEEGNANWMGSLGKTPRRKR